MQTSERRPLLVSKGWVQAVLLVVLFGFFVLGLLAYRTYMAKPPTPQRVVDPVRRRRSSRPTDIPAASRSSCATGSWSTARSSATARISARTTRPTTCAARSDSSGTSTAASASDRRGAQDDRGLPDQPLRSGDRHAHVHAPRRPTAFGAARALLQQLLLRPDDRARPAAERDHRPQPSSGSSPRSSPGRPGRPRPTRPGHDYSYTNNWPPEPLRRQPAHRRHVVVWSVLSLIALLGGIGLLFAAFGRWDFLGWHGREQADAVVPRAGRRRPDPGAARHAPGSSSSWRRCSWSRPWSGRRRQHYRADLAGFFGIDLARCLPLQPDAHLARAAVDLLGRDVVPGGRHLPRADDRRARATRPGHGWPTRCSARSPSWSSAA